MSQRGSAVAPTDTTSIVGDPSRTEPSEEADQPDQQPADSPAGDDADDDQGQNAGADQADQGADQDEDDANVDWRTRHAETEAKRRDFESKAARFENENKTLRDQVGNHQRVLEEYGQSWKNYIKQHAPDLYEQMTQAERTTAERGNAESATKGQSYAVINSVYRDGDKAFGDYLTTLVEDAGVRITPQAIVRHRATYDSIKGGGGMNGNGNGNGATVPPRASAATPAGDSRPPRVPAAGRTPTSAAAPVWKPGQPFDVTGNLRKGLKTSAQQRQRGR